MKPRHPERVPEYLQHIAAAIDRALGYTRGMDFAAFEGDTRTQDAVIRSIEVVWQTVQKDLPVLRKQIEGLLQPRQ